MALSFLPLSHAFERMVSYIYLLTGVQIIFAESMGPIARDIGTVRPTVMTGVPRVYEKLQTRIVTAGEAAPGAKGTLFRWAVKAGMARARAHARRQVPGLFVAARAALAERLVFSTVRSRLGGRLRFLVSGSAPLGANVLEFFHGDRPSDRRGLRPDRDRANPDGQSAGRAAASERSGGRFRTSNCGLRTTARSWRAGRTSWPATTTSLRRPPKCSGTAGSRPATSARSTRTDT